MSLLYWSDFWGSLQSLEELKFGKVQSQKEVCELFHITFVPLP